MASETNRFNLPRYIDADVKRLIRQRCAFHCVLCDIAIIEYEHIDPEWCDAEKHDPDRICLLCDKHHRLVTGGRIPKDHVLAEYRRIQSSTEKSAPRDDEFFSMYRSNARFVLGSCSFEFLENVIEFDGTPIFQYQPNDGFPPYVISARIFGRDGKELFTIEQNEWIGPSGVYDIQQIGRRLLIHDAPGGILFDAEKNPENNTLTISRLDMWRPPFHILLSESGLEVGRYTPDRSRGIYFKLDKWNFKGVRAAISLNSAEASSNYLDLDLSGGGGAHLVGTGITIGAGSQQTLGVGTVLVGSQ